MDKEADTVAGQGTEQWSAQAEVLGATDSQRAEAIRRLSSLSQLPASSAEAKGSSGEEAATPVQRAEAMRSLRQSFVASHEA